MYADGYLVKEGTGTKRIGIDSIDKEWLEDIAKEMSYTGEIVELKGKYVDSKDNNIGCSNCWYKENKMKSTEEYVEELGKVIKRFENEQK